MKILNSIREAYAAQLELNKLLKSKVDQILLHVKDPRWHYESRVKALESFALKIESGRAGDPKALEDFFACTLVTPDLNGLSAAMKVVQENFTVMYRRPSSDHYTQMPAQTFQFNDLRVYVKMKDEGALPSGPVNELVFEIQIKTFLQHAWAIATHDLTYKTSEVMWSKDRIVAQVKALIEQAELTIAEAEKLSSSPGLLKTDGVTKNLCQLIEILRTYWIPEELPRNLRGLAQSLASILDALGERPSALADALEHEKRTAGGSLALNLSPYAISVQALLRTRKEKCLAVFEAADLRLKVTLPKEIDVFEELKSKSYPNVIFVG